MLKRYKEVYRLVLENASDQEVITALADVLGLPVELNTAENIDRSNSVALPVPITNGEDPPYYLVVKAPSIDDNAAILVESVASLLGRRAVLRLVRDADADRSVRMQVSIAVASLSMAELIAVKHLLGQLKGRRRYSSIRNSRRAKYLRSSVASALEKLCAAQVMQKFSLGRKGTFIRVTTPQLFDEVAKLAPRNI